MQLNAAQTLIMSFFAGESVRPNVPPHRQMGTPPRQRKYDREQRFAIAFDEDGNVTAIKLPRLFKGHRT